MMRCSKDDLLIMPILIVVQTYLVFSPLRSLHHAMSAAHETVVASAAVIGEPAVSMRAQIPVT